MNIGANESVGFAAFDPCPRLTFTGGNQMRSLLGGMRGIMAQEETAAYPEKMANRFAPPQTLAQQLQYRIEQYEAEIVKMKRALELLEKNPDFAELHDILNRV